MAPVEPALHRTRGMHLARVLVVLLALALLATACGTDQPVTGPGDPAGTDEEAGDDGVDDTVDDDGADDGEATPADGERVEVLRLAGGDFGYPTPFQWVRGPGRIQAGFIFDTLLQADATGEPGPWLAEEWETSEDGLEWTFTLHDDITWQDGEPLTAHDVAFTFEYLTEGPGAATRTGGGLDVVDEVVAEDDRTVVFRLPAPLAPFESRVAASMFILPEHVWADIDDPGQYREEDALMGSGPYRLVEADEAAESYLYEANDDFFLGPPVVQRLEFVPAPDEVLALQRGQVHAAQVSRDAVPDELFVALEDDYEQIEEDGEWNHALHFNLDRGFPHDERDFRRAVAYALDREDWVDRLLLGRGLPGSSGGLSPNHPFLAPDLPAYERDLDRAAELLDGLGMTDEDGDGWRQLPDGEPFEIELVSNARFGSQDPELVAEYLRDVGLRVAVVVLDRAAADEAGAEGNYTMALQGYGGLESDPDVLRTRFHSEAPASGHSSVHGYANPEFDALAERQLTLLDVDERTEVVHEMQRILAEDLPLLSVYVPDRILFYDPAVFTNWYFLPGCTPCGATRSKHMYVTGQQTGIDRSTS
jgi:peptide/nickel transport system substrate-binding protein